MNLAILSNNSPAVTMTSREIANLVEARHDNVKRAIDRCVEKRAFAIPQIVGYLDALGRAGQSEFVLGKRESLIVVAQMCPEFTGRIVDRWQELEAKQAAPAALSVMDILHIAMESEKGRLLAIEQRDHAIATKAQIGSKREATAMATASAAKKESRELREQMGFGVNYATVMAVQSALGGERLDWLPLRRWCKAHSIPPKDVQDKRYGSVKAWPAGAWWDCHMVDLVEWFGEVAA